MAFNRDELAKKVARGQILTQEELAFIGYSQQSSHHEETEYSNWPCPFCGKYKVVYLGTRDMSIEKCCHACHKSWYA